MPQSAADLDRIRQCEDDSALDRKYSDPISEPDPDLAAEEARQPGGADEQAEIWDAIENGDIGLLAAMMGPK